MTSRSLVSLNVLGAVAVGVLVTAVTLCSHAHAQQAAGRIDPMLQRPRGESVMEQLQSPGDRFGPGRMFPLKTDNAPRSIATRKLNELRKQLRATKSTEEKDQTKTLVREALSEYFDHDMQQRREALDRLTKRADDMTALLTKREAAKDQIVDLQLKAFKYEAEGLGLFSERRTGSSIPAGVSGAAWSRATYGGIKAADGSGGMEGPVDPITAALSRVYWQARLRLQGNASAEDEAKVTAELREALGEHFDRDMESRRKELDEVKKGLADMSDCLKRRANAKDEVVDLQLQMIVNEADGLGFFSGADASNIPPGRLFRRRGANAAPVTGAGRGVTWPAAPVGAPSPRARQPADTRESAPDSGESAPDSGQSAPDSGQSAPVASEPIP